ncbi:MAG: right-handed parallel beta-helix repeat-containing protein, partial [Elusimicrobiota bacterium]
IKDVVVDNNYRQGISVISVDGLLIEDSLLRGTEGTPPAAGIDFEPNKPTERLTGITLKNCVIEKNQSYGIWVYTGNLSADSMPVQITVEGGRVAGNGTGALFVQTRRAQGALNIRSTQLYGKRSIKTSEGFTVNLIP